MNENDMLVAILAEECAEVGQRAVKLLRFGAEEVEPGQLQTNAERMAGELNDVFTIARMLCNRGVITEGQIFGVEASALKERRVNRMLDYSRKCGKLIDA